MVTNSRDIDFVLVFTVEDVLLIWATLLTPGMTRGVRVRVWVCMCVLRLFYLAGEGRHAAIVFTLS